jgi:hypothetical protein
MNKRKIVHFIFARLLLVFILIVVISDFYDVGVSTVNMYKVHHGIAMVEFMKIGEL